MEPFSFSPSSPESSPSPVPPPGIPANGPGPGAGGGPAVPSYSEERGGAFWFFPSPKEEKRQEKRLLRRAANRAGWCLLLCVVLSSLFLLLFRMFLLFVPFSNASAENLGLPLDLFYVVQTLSYLLAFTIPALLLLKLLHIPLGQAIRTEKVGFLFSAAGVCFGSMVCLLANFPAQWVVELEQSLGFSGEIPGYSMDDSPLVQALFVLSVAVVPPLVEELLFRGAILQAFRRFGDRFAVLASAFLFAFFHGNAAQIVFAFLCGLVLGLLMVKTNSIWVPVAVHGINNGFSCLTAVLYQNGQAVEAAVFSNLIFLLLLGLGLASLIFLLLHRREFFLFGKQTSPLGAGGKLSAFFVNPGIIGLLLYCIYSCIFVLLNY